MGVLFETGYSLPNGDEPLTNARIAHSGNWISGGTIAASTTATGYFEDAPDESTTYEKWGPSALPATWENDLGSALEIDYCTISGHTMGDNGNTLQVQYDSTGGGVWVDVINVAITDNQPIFCIFEPETFQKWRINITNGTAPTIAVVRFGKALQMEQAIYGGHTPLKLNRKTTVRSTRSELGEWLGRTKIRNSLGGSYSWTNLTSTFVRANIDTLIQSIETEPFFIAWRPDKFTDVEYCWTTQNPNGPHHTGPVDHMNFSMNVVAAGWL